MTEKLLLKIGSVCFGAGLVLVVVTELLHPHAQPPGNSAKAFAEYAASQFWPEIHVLQFFAILLLMFGFISLYQYLKHDEGAPAALAWLGLTAAIVTIALFAILQAVDGFSLRFVIERWTHAAAAQKDEAFRIAEAMRWIEVALNAMFRIMLGSVLALFGLAVTFGRRLPRWPGPVAVVAGIASIVFGLQVGRAGFSVSSPWGTIALALEVVWVGAMVPMMWRRSHGHDDGR